MDLDAPRVTVDDLSRPLDTLAIHGALSIGTSGLQAGTIGVSGD